MVAAGSCHTLSSLQRDGAAPPGCPRPTCTIPNAGVQLRPGDPSYNQQMGFSACSCLLKMVTGKQNKSYFNVEELHSLPALNTACSWIFPRAHLSSQHSREPSEECGLEAQALRREERSLRLDSSALHTPVSWKYKKDCFYFIAEYTPQLAGSCFNKQLHLKISPAMPQIKHSSSPF